MDLRRAYLLTCCLISVYGQFQSVNSFLTTVNTNCELAVPKVKFSLGRFTVEMQKDVLKDGERAWIGYEKNFVTFEYIGCSKAGRADMLYPLLSANVGDCYFACKKYPVFGLREYGRTCQCFHDKADWILVNNTCVSCGNFLCGDKGHTALYKQVPKTKLEEAIAFDQCLSYSTIFFGHIVKLYQWENCGSKYTIQCLNGMIDKYTDWGTSNSKCQYPYSYKDTYDGEWSEAATYWTANIRTFTITKLKENTSPLKYKLFGYVERVNNKYMLKFTNDFSLTYLSVCEKDSVLTTKGHWTTTTQRTVPSITLKTSVSTKQSLVSSSTQSNIQSFIPTTTQNSFTQHTSTMLNSPSPHTDTLSPEAAFLYVGVACAVLVIVVVFVTVFFILKRRSGRKKHNSSFNATDDITYGNHFLEIDGNTNQVKLCNNANSALDILPSFNSTDDNDKVYSADSCEYSYSSIDNLYKKEGHAEAKSIVAIKTADEIFILEKVDDQMPESKRLRNPVNNPRPEKYASRNKYEHIILENDDGQSPCYNARPYLRRCMDPALNMVYDHMNSTPGMRHSSNNDEDYDHTRAYSHAVFGNKDYDTIVLAYYKGAKLSPDDDTTHYDTALTTRTANADDYDNTSSFFRPVVDNTDYDTTAVPHHKAPKSVHVMKNMSTIRP